MSGKLIVFDGGDGSGKATQMRILIDRLEKEGYKVRTIDFPQYDNNFFGKIIADGQCGEYGNWLELDPHLTSVFYAGDRFETAPKIRKWLEDDYIVLLDRYVSANQIHQGGKIKDTIKRRKFLDFLSRLEYGVFQLPKPDSILYFLIDEETSLENLKKKKPELYKKGREDQTENSKDYLVNSRKCAQWLASQDNSWNVIDCMCSEKMCDIEHIHEQVYKIVIELLQDKKER
ncbi:MAG: dTMP kinase [Flavobacteriaceae bacterium]|jgi:dTMP kinase